MAETTVRYSVRPARTFVCYQPVRISGYCPHCGHVLFELVGERRTKGGAVIERYTCSRCGATAREYTVV